MNKRTVHCTWVLLAGLALLLQGCGASPPGINRSGPLILITVDTLRADHLSCYGYRALSTPHIDRLAGEGVRFTDASTTMPMTLPAHASILTGLIPPVHGVRDNQDYFLPDKAYTLAEHLSEAGFKTAAFIAAPVLDRCFGLAQGFDHYSDRFDPDLPTQERLKDAAAITEEAIRWIRRSGGDRFFAWLHYFDPHQQYAPPLEYMAPGLHPYDGEIAFVDDRLGRLFKELERLDLYEDGTIIFLSDHGEGLGDHGEETHGFLTYQPTVRIPLIIKSVGVPAGVVSQPVSCVDVFPTAAELLGCGEDLGAMDGISLAPLLQGRPPSGSSRIYFESYLPTRSLDFSGLRGLRNGPLKYIESSEPELFDLSEDPGEEQNRMGRSASADESLKKALAAYRDAARGRALTGGKGDPSGEASRWKEGLLELGYIGGASLAEEELERINGRPSPRNQVADYEAFLKNYMKARSLEMRGDPEGAASLYEKALERVPTYYQRSAVLNSAAQCRLRLGDLEKAESLARKALKEYPETAITFITLAQIAEARGDLERSDTLYLEFLNRSGEEGFPISELPARIRQRLESVRNRIGYDR